MISKLCSRAAVCCLAIASAVTLVAAERPNVIFIMSDDQGSVDAGCYGASDIQTPALDGLAARGVRFTQFYSASPVCSPSRAGMLTGRYPWLVGVGDNGPASPSEAEDSIEQSSGTGMDSKGINLPKMLKAAGYTTAHIGKWHLGHGRGHQPLDQGFDYSFGFLGGCIDNYSHSFYWKGPNRHDLWENRSRVRMPGRYFPDLMVEKAKAFIVENKSRPFFLYFAVNMPHYPYQGDAKWLDYYREKKVPYPRNLYAAFLSTLDERIGSLIEYLDQTGLREKTVVIFQSDNGYSQEDRAHFGGGSSGPYRGSKFSLFEGGIRLPAVISWPGRLPEGEVRGQVAHACDWLPTLAELCGVSLSEPSLNGRSIVPVIRSAAAPSPHETLVWRLGDQWAVRQGRWKLLHKPAGANKEQLAPDGFFLVNLETDPGEQKNLAAEHPEIVERLKKLSPR